MICIIFYLVNRYLLSFWCLLTSLRTALTAGEYWSLYCGCNKNMINQWSIPEKVQLKLGGLKDNKMIKISIASLLKDTNLSKKKYNKEVVKTIIDNFLCRLWKYLALDTKKHFGLRATQKYLTVKNIYFEQILLNFLILSNALK